MARTRASGASVRAMPSPGYGQKKELVALEQADGGPEMGRPPALAPDERMRQLASVINGPVGAEVSGAFGPTQRPMEPITAGVPIGPGAGSQVDMADPRLLLAAMWSVLPHPAIARLALSAQE